MDASNVRARRECSYFRSKTVATALKLKESGYSDQTVDRAVRQLVQLGDQLRPMEWRGAAAAGVWGEARTPGGLQQDRPPRSWPQL